MSNFTKEQLAEIEETARKTKSYQDLKVRIDTRDHKQVEYNDALMLIQYRCLQAARKGDFHVDVEWDVENQTLKTLETTFKLKLRYFASNEVGNRYLFTAL